MSETEARKTEIELEEWQDEQRREQEKALREYMEEYHREREAQRLAELTQTVDPAEALHEERQAWKRERASWLEAHKYETDTRLQAERRADEWRSLCLGLHEVMFAIIEQLSVDLQIEQAKADDE